MPRPMLGTGDHPVRRCPCHGAWTWRGTCTITDRTEPTRDEAPDMPPITDLTSRLAAYRVKQLRTNLGMTLSQLADALAANTSWSPSVSQLSNVERCQRSISLTELAALSEVLDTTTDHLIRAGEICEACGQELPK